MHRFQDSLAGCGKMPGLSINIDLDLPQLASESGSSTSLRSPQAPITNERGESNYFENPKREPSSLVENTGEYLPTLECIEIEDTPICDMYSLPVEGGLGDGENPFMGSACKQIMDLISKCDKTKAEEKPPTSPAHQGESDKGSFPDKKTKHDDKKDDEDKEKDDE